MFLFLDRHLRIDFEALTKKLNTKTMYKKIKYV